MNLVIQYQSPFQIYSETSENSLTKIQFTRKVKVSLKEQAQG